MNIRFFSNSLLVKSGFSILVIAGLFYWLTYPDIEAEIADDGSSQNNWHHEARVMPAVPDPQAVVSSGFWGTPVDEAGLEGMSDTKADQTIVLQNIRQHIRAIMPLENKQGMVVIFETEGGLKRYQVGETVNGTGWEIVEIDADRIALSKPGQEEKVLRLYNIDAQIEGFQ